MGCPACETETVDDVVGTVAMETELLQRFEVNELAVCGGAGGEVEGRGGGTLSGKTPAENRWRPSVCILCFVCVERETLTTERPSW